MSARLQVCNLSVHFVQARRSLFTRPSRVRAVDGVSFDIQRGRSLGLVGESGSGKSTTALAVTRLVEPTSGSVRLDGRDITALTGDALRRSRSDYQIIFQDPYSSLNPRMRMGNIVRAPLDRLGRGTLAERDEKVVDLLKGVGLRPDQRLFFPHQFSGGQRQRINIARALASEPKLIVCDEPTSALDVAVRAQTLNLLRRLQDQMDLTYLFISHDMAVVEYMCDDVAVMYMGKIVEHARARPFFTQPLHPYSWVLMSAVPRLSAQQKHPKRMAVLRGETPDPANPPPGCSFSSRCPFAEDRCRREMPPLRSVGADKRLVACHLVSDSGEAPQAALKVR